MGVTGLWQIVQPCARPIKIETLNRKRLAVDASIWIYQFLKAVRDKEGNALRNSHVVGFFRRICKLLFFGIKPVFVFDGGAPALKRQTIRARKSRREGRRDDAVRTAGKLLAVQMQRRAEEEEAQRKAERDREHEQEETVPDEGLVYVDELQMTQQERQQNRKFRKKDQYHLPDLDVSLSEMSGANDPRVMSLEELQTYARQFDTGEDINVYDFSKIDYDSPFFMSLPASDRYNILNAARLRSRLRMGYSKDQLDTMYPDRMAFSKFQIERVRERNELTQRLMHLNGFEGTEFGGGRVAGEKGREYVLVKNDGVEGGWALGVITDEGKEEMPIDVDRPAPAIKQHQDEWEDEEDDFEDVSVAGLNRLPKRPTQNDEVADKLMEQRRAVYSSRKQAPKPKPKRVAKKDRSELFVQSSEDEEEDWEEVEEDRDLFGDGEGEGSEDEELRKAIALSLQKEDGGQGQGVEGDAVEDEDDDMLEVFQQSAVEEQKPVPKGSGRDIASIVNKRAFNTAPESREITYFGVPHEKSDESDESDTMDLQAALAESRKTKRKTSPPRRPQVPPKRTESATDIAKQAGFKGPLPFEKLDLGSSLLGKRKMQERTEETAGGFENPELAEKQKKKTAEPLPPWFSGDLEADIEAQNAIESEDRRRAREFENQFQFQDRGAPTLRRDPTNEVIDLEADDINEPSGKAEVINLEDDGEAAAAPVDHIMEKNQLTIAIDDDAPSVTPDRDVNMGDIADEVRAEPEKAFPDPSVDMADVPPVRRVEKEQPEERVNVRSASPAKARHADEEDEALDWSDSDHEEDRRRMPDDKNGLSTVMQKDRSANDATPATFASNSKDADDEDEDEDLGFEDVEIPDAPPAQREQEAVEEDDDQPRPPTLPAQETIPEDDDEFDDFSDPEEAEMLRQLTLEAEEHARFASSLNNKSTAQNIQEYEKELKQLRNQQKKDRRDADEVTQIMIQECQALLRLFGLPYITAPMEAEAQCAELVSMGLVDGIVTDDSDCFLFGGTRIYKNMFNQAKFVECYLTSDLEKEFDLSRDKLIAVAHLLGSDYTEGIPGIGPVTALEIISEFGSLTAFSDWWTAVQMNQISKEEDAKNPFRKKFRRNATKMFLPPGFPDERVNLAYKTPDVDHNPEAFQWGVPDLGALRSFLMATIGWTQERTDEVLVPVIKDMNRRLDEGTQANITHFFDGAVGIGAAGASSSAGKGEGFAPRKRAAGSKRMGNALTKMAEHAKRNRQLREGDVPCTEDGDAADEEEPTKGGNNTAKRRKTKATASANASATASDGDDSSEFNETRSKKTKGKKTAKATRGTSRKKKAVE